MTKRWLSLALALVMCMGLLSGCAEGWTPPPEEEDTGDITLSGTKWSGQVATTLILHPDGTVDTDLNGEKGTGTWEAGSGDIAMVAHITVKGDPVDVEIIETDEGYSAEFTPVPDFIITGKKGGAAASTDDPAESEAPTDEPSASPEPVEYPENSLVLDFTPDTSEQLQKMFYVESSTWEPALGASGSYTPTESEEELFAWITTGSSVHLTFYANGTYKYEFTTMSIEETGTWTWADQKLTVTTAKGNSYTGKIVSGDEEPENTYPENSLVLDFTPDTSEKLQKMFYVESGTWGPALGASGSYTPTESEEELFAWITTGSSVHLTLYANGTYKYEFTTMNIEETGTWTFEGFKLTLTTAKGATYETTIAK